MQAAEDATGAAVVAATEALDVDLAGARAVKKAMPEATSVFLAPPSWETLESRLIGRGTETPEVIARRLETAPMQVALTWLLARSPNLLLIPGTSSVAHLEENMLASARVLGPLELQELDRIGGTGEPDVDL